MCTTIIQDMSKLKLTRRKKQLIINNPKAAQILLDNELIPYLLPFSGPSRTMKDVALELDMSIKDLHYYVGKLCKHNLLAVAKIEPRAGRPIKYYRTSATDFIIPYKASTAASPKEFAETVIGAFFQIFYQSFLPKSLTPQVGIKVRVKNGQFNKFYTHKKHIQWHDQLDFPKPYNLNIVELGGLYLSEEEATSLQQSLLDLFNRYKRSEPQDSSQKLFLLHWGFAKAQETKIEKKSQKETKEKSINETSAIETVL